jgi:hypothetical protein
MFLARRWPAFEGLKRTLGHFALAARKLELSANATLTREQRRETLAILAENPDFRDLSDWGKVLQFR